MVVFVAYIRRHRTEIGTIGAAMRH
jgi:hypothetical protein